MNATDVYFCSFGSCSDSGGTSASSPLWAGFMALVNQQAVEAGTAPSGGVGFLNPAIYPIGKGSSYDSDFHDITIGNNDTGTSPSGLALLLATIWLRDGEARPGRA
jgi:subtilase family serine protease